MAEYTIDKIEYDGNVYILQDNESGYITVESDPVFSASAAAGISATDISNWNAKVSDDKTWNGVSLNKSTMTTNQSIYVPYVATTTATEAKLVEIIAGTTAAHKIPKYDNYAYLYSTTPSANDNSTKVATTAYVDAAIPSISLNGSSTTSASFYAPTTAGTSGQVLTSNGSGAPTWAAATGGTSTQIIRWSEDNGR